MNNVVMSSSLTEKSLSVACTSKCECFYECMEQNRRQLNAILISPPAPFIHTVKLHTRLDRNIRFFVLFFVMGSKLKHTVVMI